MDELLTIIGDMESLLARARKIVEDKEPPTPTPTPAPEPEPAGLPERTGSPVWTGQGKFNSYKEITGTASPAKKVRVRAWFKATAWSGGGESQPQGFCLANKGIVGSHWGFLVGIRPNGIVANGTKGEVVGVVAVALGEWHYIDISIEKRKVSCALDGKSVVFPTPTIDLLQASGEPLRIGGFRCPWPQATWFNQSIKGQISSGKNVPLVEIS